MSKKRARSKPIASRRQFELAAGFHLQQRTKYRPPGPDSTTVNRARASRGQDRIQTAFLGFAAKTRLFVA
jgi:hypothetical protein